MQTSLNWLHKIVEAVLYALITVMTVIICYEVVSRFCFDYSPSWILQLSLLLMIWVSIIGLSVALADNTHIQLSAIVDRLPQPIKRWVEFFHRLMALFFGAFMLVYGYQFTKSMWGSLLPTLPVSNGLLYLPVAIGGLFSVVYVLADLFGLWKPKAENREMDVQD